MKGITLMLAIVWAATGCFSQKMINTGNLEAKVYFETSASGLDSAAIKTLDSILNEAKKLGEFSIVVYGNTDSVGELGFNQKLSEKRSAAVGAYFEQNKVQRDRIECKAFGEIKPRFTNKNEVGRRHNRRVDIYIKGWKNDKDTTISRGCHYISIEAGAFSPYSMDEIDFTIRPIENQQDLQNSGLSSWDSRGNPLSSNNMLELFAQAKDGSGKLTPRKGTKMKVGIASLTQMEDTRIYTSREIRPGQIEWEETPIPYTIKKTTCGGVVYEFELPVESEFGGKINLDKRCTARNYCRCRNPFAWRESALANDTTYLEIGDDIFMAKAGLFNNSDTTSNVYPIARREEYKCNLLKDKIFFNAQNASVFFNTQVLYFYARDNHTAKAITNENGFEFLYWVHDTVVSQYNLYRGYRNELGIMDWEKIARADSGLYAKVASCGGVYLSFKTHCLDTLMIARERPLKRAKKTMKIKTRGTKPEYLLIYDKNWIGTDLVRYPHYGTQNPKYVTSNSKTFEIDTSGISLESTVIVAYYIKDGKYWMAQVRLKKLHRNWITKKHVLKKRSFKALRKKSLNQLPIKECD